MPELTEQERHDLPEGVSERIQESQQSVMEAQAQLQQVRNHSQGLLETALAFLGLEDVPKTRIQFDMEEGVLVVMGEEDSEEPSDSDDETDPS